jgi:ribosomal protein S27AE
LEEWLPEFEALDGVERDESVARLRVFLEVCPSCGGDLEEREDSRNAATVEVSAPDLSCTDCGGGAVLSQQNNRVDTTV